MRTALHMHLAIVTEQCFVVLRMLSVYVGIDKFLKGVSIYLKGHLFGNSVTKDLWKGIQEASGECVCVIRTRGSAHRTM